MNGLKKVESRLDGLSTAIADITPSLEVHNHLRELYELNHNAPSILNNGTNAHAASYTSPKSSVLTEEVNYESQFDETQVSSSRTAISLSQHHVLFWPAIQRQITEENVTFPFPRKEYASDLEIQRENLTMTINPYPPGAGDAWVDKLPFSIITALSEAYFATFNLISPVLDQDAYFYDTLPSVLRNGFGYNMQCCLVLNVLALGCMAVKGYQECDFPLPRNPRYFSSAEEYFESPEWIGILDEEPPGLSFHNEARKRIGAALCSHDLPSCQFYLLSGYAFSRK